MYIWLTEEEAVEEAIWAGHFDNYFKAVPHECGARIYAFTNIGEYRETGILAIGASARKLNTINRIAYSQK